MLYIRFIMFVFFIMIYLFYLFYVWLSFGKYMFIEVYDNELKISELVLFIMSLILLIKIV